MRKRILLACAIAGGSLAVAAPLAATAGSEAASIPAACVVIHGPATIQAGYAPTGPTGCTQV